MSVERELQQRRAGHCVGKSDRTKSILVNLKFPIGMQLLPKLTLPEWYSETNNIGNERKHVTLY